MSRPGTPAVASVLRGGTLAAIGRRVGRGAKRPGAPRNRAISLFAVLAYGAAAVAWVPDPERRAGLHAIVVIGLGYGHLVGATGWLRPRGAAAPRGGAAIGRWRRLAIGLGVAGAFVAFTTGVAAGTPLVLGLLAVSTWHTVENDWSLEDAYAAGGRPVAPRLGLDDQLVTLGATALLLAAAGAALATEQAGAPGAETAATPRLLVDPLRGIAALAGALLCVRERSDRAESVGLALVGGGVLLPARIPLAFADVFALATGYHLVSWIVVTWDGKSRSRRGALRVLAASHAGPVALAAVCAWADGPAAARLRDAFFAPAPYLFWSVAHVGHTLVRRASRRGAARTGDQSASGDGSDAAAPSTG